MMLLTELESMFCPAGTEETLDETKTAAATE